MGRGNLWPAGRRSPGHASDGCGARGVLVRRAAKIDTNQPEIVEAFRRFGCSVHPCHSLGKGFPDLVVGRAGKNLLVEIKDGQKPSSKQRLTPDETKWHELWEGTVVVVTSVDDVVRVCGEYL